MQRGGLRRHQETSETSAPHKQRRQERAEGHLGGGSLRKQGDGQLGEEEVCCVTAGAGTALSVANEC